MQVARDAGGEKKMDTAAIHSEPKAMPQAQAAREKNTTVDRFADARRAKKKAKRVRHRAKLKRSHTKG
jgi:hypothetical protein